MDDKTNKMPMANGPEAIAGSPEIAGGNPESHLGMDTNLNAGSGMDGFSEPSFLNKRRKFIPIIAGAAAVVLIAAGGAVFALNQPAPESNDPAPTTVEDVAPTDEEDKYENENFKGEGEAELKVNVGRYTGYENPLEVAPVVAHIKGVSDGAKDVDYYTALSPAEDPKYMAAKVKFDKSQTYEVEFIDTFVSDGSLIKFDNNDDPSTGDFHATIGKITVSAKSQEEGNDSVYNSDIPSNRIEAQTDHVTADQVTQEDVDRVMKQLKEAVAKGDETLSGEKGQAVIDAAAKNAAANPNVDQEKLTSQTEEAKQNVTDIPTATTGSANDSGIDSADNAGNTGTNNTAPSPSTPSTNPSNASSTPTPPVNNTTPAPAPDPKPQHIHSPKDINRTETYVITPETITTTEYYTCSDGNTYYPPFDIEAHCIINDLSYSVKTKKNVIPAVTGTRSVYDHTECSTCGAIL